MSGFLHQLARRSRRNGSSIHSRARLPYAELPAWPEQAELIAAPDVAGGPSENRIDRGGRQHDSRGLGTAPEGSGSAPIQGASVKSAKPEGPSEENRGAAGTDMKVETEVATTAAPPRIFTPLVSAPSDGDRPVAAGGEHGSQITRVEGTRSRRNPAAPKHRSFDRPPAANRLASEASSGEQLPDVHISIGRVEVIAATPPAPKRAPPRAQETMLLEKYLERRVREKR